MFGLTTGRSDSQIAERSTLAIAQPSAWLACSSTFCLLPSPAPRGNDDRFVYFARHDRSFKIGISERPLLRVSTLKPAGHRLALIIFACGTQHERALHAHLAAERTTGEYFQGKDTEQLFATFAINAALVSSFIPAWGERGDKPADPNRAQQILAGLLKNETQVSFSKRSRLSQPTISNFLSGRSKPTRLEVALSLERMEIPLDAWDQPAITEVSEAYREVGA